MNALYLSVVCEKIKLSSMKQKHQKKIIHCKASLPAVQVVEQKYRSAFLHSVEQRVCALRMQLSFSLLGISCPVQPQLSRLCVPVPTRNAVAVGKQRDVFF